MITDWNHGINKIKHQHLFVLVIRKYLTTDWKPNPNKKQKWYFDNEFQQQFRLLMNTTKSCNSFTHSLDIINHDFQVFKYTWFPLVTRSVRYTFFQHFLLHSYGSHYLMWVPFPKYGNQMDFTQSESEY